MKKKKKKKKWKPLSGHGPVKTIRFADMKNTPMLNEGFFIPHHDPIENFKF